jgi:hypothetical protein
LPFAIGSEQTGGLQGDRPRNQVGERDPVLLALPPAMGRQAMALVTVELDPDHVDRYAHDARRERKASRLLESLLELLWLTVGVHQDLINEVIEVAGHH